MTQVILLPLSAVDAKGDLLVGSADNAVIRKGVGADGQVLTADAAAAGGVKWADPPSSPNAGRSFVSGLWYAGDVIGQDSTVGLQNNTEALIPFTVGKSKSFDRIGVEVTTAVAATTGHLAIRNDSANGPGSIVVVAAGTIDMSTTGAKELTIAQLLPAGSYWVSVTSHGGAPTIRGRGPQPGGRIGATIQQNAYESFLEAGSTAGAPVDALASALTVRSNVPSPKIMLRAA